MKFIGIKKVLERLKIPLDEPYNRLTRQRISLLEDIGLKEGKSRASIQTWRGYIKSITARWACLMYEDRGWEVHPIATQPFNIAQKAYEALPAETVQKIDEWIASLRANPETREQFKFGMHYHGTLYMPDHVDRTIAAMVACGVKLVRTDTSLLLRALPGGITVIFR